MKLSNILSKAPSADFLEISGFINKKLPVGKQQKISVGKVALNYYCDAENCKDTRTFFSSDDLYCIGVNQRQVSIDCVLKCSNTNCSESVVIWFLVECEDSEDIDKRLGEPLKNFNNYIYGVAPRVRILKKREKLSDKAKVVSNLQNDYVEMLDKSERAYRDGLGAGSVVYLRLILEKEVKQTAKNENVDDYFKDGNGENKNKSFTQLLKDVDEKCNIVPKEFSKTFPKLYGIMSGAAHGNISEKTVLEKYEPIKKLVTGILENIQYRKNYEEASTILGLT